MGSARSARTGIRTLLENLDDPTDGDTARGVVDVQSLIDAADDDGFPVTLEEHGATEPLSSSAGLTAHRIVQEALADAMRHGSGDSIRVTLDWRDERLAIFIVSSLKTDAAPTEEESGRNLLGTEERARSVGGRLTAGRDGTEHIVAAHVSNDDVPAA